MKSILFRFLAIGLAGSIGAIARYVVSLLFGRLNIRFPAGTFFINISGSLFLGWFLAHIATRNVSDNLRLAIGVGFVGAYTTFSTYMYESNKLFDDGLAIAAMVNLVGSVVVGLIAVRVGLWLGRSV
jgi:fluoride exporter